MKVEAAELEELLKENIKATRVANGIALSVSMGLDITEPLDAAKVKRHLSNVERYID